MLTGIQDHGEVSGHHGAESQDQCDEAEAFQMFSRERCALHIQLASYMVCVTNSQSLSNMQSNTETVFDTNLHRKLRAPTGRPCENREESSHTDAYCLHHSLLAVNGWFKRVGIRARGCF